MAKNDLEYQLRMEIKEQLRKVTRANSPNIYAAIHHSNGSLNLKGYARIEGKLVQKIIAGQLTPAAAIPQLEQELDLL
jgi:ABC-type glycerol-3-phosphate transport system substrate-binding protein